MKKCNSLQGTGRGGKRKEFVFGVLMGACALSWVSGSFALIRYMRMDDHRAPTLRSPAAIDDSGWKKSLCLWVRAIYEKSNPFCHDPNREWYGQYHQDVMVSTLLKNKTNGFFVDLAANHPTFLSSTYSLEKRLNWSGVCIEPNSQHWWGLTQARTCQLVGAVIGQKKMEEITFRTQNIDKVGGHGGIIKKGMKNERAPAGDGQSFYTVTLDEALRRANAPRTIDFLSVDVEGAEDFILMAFQFNDYRISLLNIETAALTLRTHLVDNGFRMVARSGEDSLWAHESVKNMLDADYLLNYRNTLRTGDPKF